MYGTSSSSCRSYILVLLAPVSLWSLGCISSCSGLSPGWGERPCQCAEQCKAPLLCQGWQQCHALRTDAGRVFAELPAAACRDVVNQGVVNLSDLAWNLSDCSIMAHLRKKLVLVSVYLTSGILCSSLQMKISGYSVQILVMTLARLFLTF